MTTKLDQERLRRRAAALKTRGFSHEEIGRTLNRSRAWVAWAIDRGRELPTMPADVPLRILAAIRSNTDDGTQVARLARRYKITRHTVRRIRDLAKDLGL